MINKYKLCKIVRYIKQHDFEFEVREVIEELDKVLSHFNLIGTNLTDGECNFLIKELIPLAEQFEFHEAQYLAFQDELFFEQQHAATF